MTKGEFMEYVTYLGKTFEIAPPTDKEVLQTWYKPFENIHLTIAKKMASLYLYHEPGKFKFAKLLEYKSEAMAGVTYSEEKNECKICNGTGFVQVEIDDGIYTHPYTVFRRCLCKNGQKLNSKIRQIVQYELEEMVLCYDGVYRDPENAKGLA
jgi:hypothetical protein